MAGNFVPYFKSKSTEISEEEDEKQFSSDLVNTSITPLNPVGGLQHFHTIKAATEQDNVRSSSPYINTINPVYTDNSSLSLARSPSQATHVRLLGHPFSASPTLSAIHPSVEPMTLSDSVMVHSSTQLISSNTSISFKTSPSLSSPLNSVSSIKLEPMSPSRVISPAKKGTVKKVIIIQPGEDAESATARAMHEITENLNKQAAERLAEGRTPEKETRIEITRIKAPDEGYFNRESILGSQQKRPIANASLVSLVSTQGELSHQHHRRKSPHPKRHMYHVPTPPQKSETEIFPDHKECYFSPNIFSMPKCSFATATRGDVRCVTAAMGSFSVPSASATLGASNPSNVFTTNMCRPNLSQRPAILRNSSIRIVNKLETSTNGPTGSVSLSSSDSDSGSEVKITPKLNDSLTNIQWLGSMSSDKLGPPHRDLRIYPSEKQMEKISRECGKKKRPPYSYMHLIQMAICSKPDRKMTLREIYHWIEEKFPYYGHSANHGWKNSIRHNLSLYDIFVREKPQIPGRTGSSYWTIRPDLSVRTTKAARTIVSLDSSTTNIMEPSSPASNSFMATQSPSNEQTTPGINCIKTKKGPVPIKPKPALQTFALIPIQGGVSVSGQQMAMMSQWRVDSPQPVNENSNSHTDSISGSVLKTSQKRVNSPMELDGPKRKHVKIAPTVNVLDEKNIVQQQRLNSSQNSNCSQLSGTALSNSLDTSELRSQFSRIQVDSGLELSSASSGRDTPNSELDAPNSMRGMPKPKLYGSSRRKQNLAACVRTTPPIQERKPKQEGTVLSLNDSAEASESGISDILASIEKDLSSPMKNLLRTPPKETNKSLLTSTPFKGALISPSWMSPIKGITPIAGEDVLGMAMVTPDQGTQAKTSTPLTPEGKAGRLCAFSGLTPLKLIPLLSPGTPGRIDHLGMVDGSPNTSFKDINNQSFSKLLGEFHLDSLIDEGINLDMSNISFSAFQ